MGYQELTIELFGKMLENAAANISNNQERINTLNVFPVPDGDTGSNMTLTFTSGVSDTLATSHRNLKDMSKALSRGLLMGARGNSGVILSQIFRGFSKYVESHNTIDASSLMRAFVFGAKEAYKAVIRPIEGTILTVIRESSESAYLTVEKNKIQDIEEAMVILVNEANKSLETTPDLLPVLKEVGVVDSGGAGLVCIFEGFLAAIQGKNISTSSSQAKDDSVFHQLENDEFGYCTEFIIRLNKISNFSESSLREALSLIGNSLVVVQDEELVKVHVHTLTPGEALNIGQRYGEFAKLKIENMQEQHHHLSLTKPQETKKEYALISVASGEGMQEMFKELRVDYVIAGGQTMNPSTQDFVEAIKKVNAKIVYLLPNNSNIIMAANSSVELVEDCKVVVIPTKTIPQGMNVCMMFNPEVKEEENTKAMNEAISEINSGCITYAIKDTTYNGLLIKQNEYIAILEKDIVECHQDKLEAAKKLIDNMVKEEHELVYLLYGEDVSEQEAEILVSYIEEKGLEVELHYGKQPVYHFIVGIV